MADRIPIHIPDDVKARFWSNVDLRGATECWPWIGYSNPRGYGRFYFFGKSRAATHAAILMETGSFPPPGMLACHHCDNPNCVNPAHLFLGTSADNNADRDRKGRGRWVKIRDEDKPRGSRHGSAKFSEADILTIRASRISIRVMAREMGVDRKTIWEIRNRKTWKHV